MEQVGFVGDVHGNLRAVEGMLRLLSDQECTHVVFLGDYLNKGPSSAGVLDLLVSAHAAGGVTLLAGNHEAALLDALASNDLRTFLKMGGAATIRAYVGGPVRADVLAHFRAALPTAHLAALRAMPDSWEASDIVARHVATTEEDRFEVSAHVFAGLTPRITARTAQIDTGCGSDRTEGRLTAFLWPSRAYVQVDSNGDPLF